MTPTCNEYTVSPLSGSIQEADIKITYNADGTGAWADPTFALDQIWASPLTLNDGVSGTADARFDDVANTHTVDISADPYATPVRAPLVLDESLFVGFATPADVQAVTDELDAGPTAPCGLRFANPGVENATNAFGLTPQMLWERAATLPDTDTIWATIFGTNGALDDAFWSVEMRQATTKPALRLVA